VPDTDLQTFFNAADVFVFPSRSILNSSSISLAMSFGLPCIAPNIGGIPELIGDSGGIIYNPETKGALLNALCDAITRSAELEEIGAINQRRAGAMTWAAAADKTACVYSQLRHRHFGAEPLTIPPRTTG